MPAEVFVEVGVEARDSIRIQTRAMTEHPAEVELQLPEGYELLEDIDPLHDTILRVRTPWGAE